MNGCCLLFITVILLACPIWSTCKAEVADQPSLESSLSIADKQDQGEVTSRQFGGDLGIATIIGVVVAGLFLAGLVALGAIPFALLSAFGDGRFLNTATTSQVNQVLPPIIVPLPTVPTQPPAPPPTMKPHLPHKKESSSSSESDDKDHKHPSIIFISHPRPHDKHHIHLHIPSKKRPHGDKDYSYHPDEYGIDDDKYHYDPLDSYPVDDDNKNKRRGPQKKRKICLDMMKNYGVRAYVKCWKHYAVNHDRDQDYKPDKDPEFPWKDNKDYDSHIWDQEPDYVKDLYQNRHKKVCRDMKERYGVKAYERCWKLYFGKDSDDWKKYKPDEGDHGDHGDYDSEGDPWKYHSDYDSDGLDGGESDYSKDVYRRYHKKICLDVIKDYGVRAYIKCWKHYAVNHDGDEDYKPDKDPEYPWKDKKDYDSHIWDKEPDYLKDLYQNRHKKVCRNMKERYGTRAYKRCWKLYFGKDSDDWEKYKPDESDHGDHGDYDSDGLDSGESDYSKDVYRRYHKKICLDVIKDYGVRAYIKCWKHYNVNHDEDQYKPDKDPEYPWKDKKDYDRRIWDDEPDYIKHLYLHRHQRLCWDMKERYGTRAYKRCWKLYLGKDSDDWKKYKPDDKDEKGLWNRHPSRWPVKTWYNTDEYPLYKYYSKGHTKPISHDRPGRPDAYHGGQNEKWKPHDRYVDRPGETKPYDRYVDRPGEPKPYDRYVDRPGETKPYDRYVDRPGEPKPYDRYVDRPGEPKPYDRYVDRPGETKPHDRYVDRPGESKPSDRYVDRPGKPKPLDRYIDRPGRPKISHRHIDRPGEPKIPDRHADRPKIPAENGDSIPDFRNQILEDTSNFTVENETVDDLPSQTEYLRNITVIEDILVHIVDASHIQDQNIVNNDTQTSSEHIVTNRNQTDADDQTNAAAYQNQGQSIVGNGTQTASDHVVTNRDQTNADAYQNQGQNIVGNDTQTSSNHLLTNRNQTIVDTETNGN